ncbi:hypothetical protein INR49_007837, partial [Caranx melampygus]
MNFKWTVKRFLLMSFSVSHLLLLEGAQSRLSVAEGRLQRRANALRRKRDLLGEEVGTLHLREPDETYRPLLSEGSLSRSILHNYTARDSSSEYCGCLNGGWCQEGGVCDCAQFQALGDRCQIIPNQGQDRDGICRSWVNTTLKHLMEYTSTSLEPAHTFWPRTATRLHHSTRCGSTTAECVMGVYIHAQGLSACSSQMRTRSTSLDIRSTREAAGVLSLPQTVGGVFIERLADYLLVKSVFGFSLAWDGGSGVYLKMSEDHHGAPCGLCGNFNHIAGDDLTTAR